MAIACNLEQQNRLQRRTNLVLAGTRKALTLIWLTGAMFFSIAQLDARAQQSSKEGTESKQVRIEDFFGVFEGVTLVVEAAENEEQSDVELRDLRVEIGPSPSGFEVQWQSLSRWESGKVKRRVFHIEFAKRSQPGLYASQMKKDMFGNRKPMDPMQGQPYFWAQLHQDTLTVSAFRVLDDGGYEVQVYDRKLVADGLELSYRRIHNLEVVKSMKSKLARKPGQ